MCKLVFERRTIFVIKIGFLNFNFNFKFDIIIVDYRNLLLSIEMKNA